MKSVWKRKKRKEETSITSAHMQEAQHGDTATHNIAHVTVCEWGSLVPKEPAVTTSGSRRWAASFGGGREGEERGRHQSDEMHITIVNRSSEQLAAEGGTRDEEGWTRLCIMADEGGGLRGCRQNRAKNAHVQEFDSGKQTECLWPCLRPCPASEGPQSHGW